MKFFGVFGDTHGNHNIIKKTIKNVDAENIDIFHVGDFGVGFISESQDRKNLEDLNNALKERNCTMYVARGNHDNPYYFDGSWEWSNLKLVPDYTVIETNGDRVLMVGGAVSIDRKPRLKEAMMYARQNVDKDFYWHDEVFVLDEEKLRGIKGVRYVITHSAPYFVEPINNTKNLPYSHGGLVEHFVIEGDTKLKDDLNKERQDIAKMYEILKENNYIQKWMYGHFHRHNAMYYEDTDFVCLNVNEFLEIRQ